MKTLIPATVLMLLVSACSTQITCNGPTELCEPVETFKAEAKARGITMMMGTTVEYAEAKDMPAHSEVGDCTAADGSNRILVNKGSYPGMDKQMQEALIFHELGHCALGRKHREATLKNPAGMPVSVMWPTSGTEFYLHQRDFYLNELFTAVVDEGMIK